MTEEQSTASMLSRYVTLAQARAMECNGCGDCCDTSRTDGFWAWAALPRDQFASMNDGAPLIIPIERVEDGWRDRAWEPDDALDLRPTRFRCAAFRPQDDGRGLCGRHTLERPAVCGEFPVHVIGLDRDVEELGEVPLMTGALPRCTWYRMTVVREDDPRAEVSVEDAASVE
jgi:Fe-S-cluster containining protein